MGRAAAAGSQLVIVTSDNPRTEDPLAIIREIEPGLADSRPGPPRRGRGQERRGGLPGNPGPPGGHPPGRGPGPARGGGPGGRQGPRKLPDLGDERRHFDDREEVAQALRSTTLMPRQLHHRPKFWPPPAAPWCSRGAWETFCGVNTDSRTCQTGELFIPLTGERHDGHEFIPKALQRGARGVLVEEGFVGARFEARPYSRARRK